MLRFSKFAFFVFLLCDASRAASSMNAIPIGTNGAPNGYWESLPSSYNSNPNQTFPVVIFLHGMDAVGSGSPDDLQKIYYGPVELIKNDAEPLHNLFDERGVIVLAPQHNWWWNAVVVRNFLNWAIPRYRIDPNRIYMTGLSSGSFGTIDFMNKDANARQCAGFIACAYRGDLVASGAQVAKDVPLWILTARGDFSSHPETAVDLIASTITGTTNGSCMANYPGGYTPAVDYTGKFTASSGWDWTPGVDASAGVNPKLTIFAGTDHNSWDRTYKNINTWNWLFSLTKAPPALNGKGTGLQAEYFDNMDLTAPKLTRVDSTINFDWGTGSPDASIGADTFSVRWKGQIQPRYTETYTFSTISDDGVRLWINGQIVIDNWTLHPPTENSGAIALQAGQLYDLRMEFFENGGGAVAKLLWLSPSQSKEIVPQSQLFPPTTGNGLLAEYYSNMSFAGTALTRVDPVINFNWGNGGPDSAIAADYFSARWTGKVVPKFSESYTFSTISDDGVRLWIDGQLVIDNWTLHPPTENSGTIALKAGQFYDVKVEFYENAGGAVAQLMWASASQAKEIVPQSQLFAALSATRSAAPVAEFVSDELSSKAAEPETSIEFSSHATAIPNPALVGHAITFTAAASGSDSAVYSWDFGDGSTALGATTSHSYSIAGNYSAIVTVISSSGTISESVGLTVRSASEIMNANVKLTLNFTQASADKLSISGAFAGAPPATFAGQIAKINFGGVERSFPLSAAGLAFQKSESIKIVPGKLHGKSVLKFKVSLSGEDLQTQLSDEGLSNVNCTKMLLKVPFSIDVNGETCQRTFVRSYSSKANRCGIYK